MTTKREVLKHETPGGLTLYGLVLTPGELRLVRGLIGKLRYPEGVSSRCRERLYSLYGYLNRAEDRTVRFVHDPEISPHCEELLTVLEVEAAEPDPFAEED